MIEVYSGKQYMGKGEGLIKCKESSGRVWRKNGYRSKEIRKVCHIYSKL